MNAQLKACFYLSLFFLIIGCEDMGKDKIASATLVNITVTPTKPSIALGITQQFTAIGTYSNNTRLDLTTSINWRSSNTSVTTINGSGTATAAYTGTAIITATLGNISDSTTLRVSAINLPKTGQTIKYAEDDDGSLQKGIAWPKPRFKSGEGIEVDCIIDNLTGLIWAKSPVKEKTWIDALAFAKDLTLCGYSDWRLPNINELESIGRAERSSPIAWLNSQGFNIIVKNSNHWSSTTNVNDKRRVWVTSLSGGVATALRTFGTGNAWVVRGSMAYGSPASLPKTGQLFCYSASGVVIPCKNTGQDGELQKGVEWPSPRFTIEAELEADCVTDNLTGLMWVKSPDSTARTWINALSYANELNLCGYNDWRLPNNKELRSLIHYGQPDAAAWLNSQGFNNIKPDQYWSSSDYPYSTDWAWSINMGDGWMIGNKKPIGFYVWPVRSGL